MLIISEVDAGNVSSKGKTLYCYSIKFIILINIQNFLFIYLFECLQDGHINCDEFVAMMRKGNPEANLKKRRDNLNL